MDLLNKDDRQQLREDLESLFEPMGTTDQFIVLTFGKETRVCVLHFMPEVDARRHPDLNAEGPELLRLIVEGKILPDSFLEF